MSAFFIISAFVMWGLFATTGLWLGCCFPALSKGHLVGGVPVVCTAFVIVAITLTRTHYNAFASILYYASYILFGLAFIAFCVSASFSILFLILKLFHISARTYLGNISILVMGILFLCALGGGFSSPKIKHIALSSPNIPPLKIALISDSHVGTGVSYARWAQALTRLEKEKPDIVLVLGDLFEYGANADKYAERLAAFKTPLGTYGVLGNHEYYRRYANSLDFYQKAHIHLLQNEIVTLPNGIQLAGFKDIRAAHVTEEEAVRVLRQADKNKPLLLLSHTPMYAEQAAANGVNLMLSGHTHNGQIWPFNYLVKLQFPRVYGLFDVNDMKFYITSGMFYWGIPLRLFSPAELPILEVNR
ncbi:MAG: metallophosphoesterase [Elusimicrobiaceae bacterium]|nr:metallophosphoesterase [Elusimicrobiaceae bacterium]